MKIELSKEDVKLLLNALQTQSSEYYPAYEEDLVFRVLQSKLRNMYKEE